MTAVRRGKPAKPAEQAIQFKVQLRYIRPPIWRRVVLPDNATLGDLHAVIQTAMGWFNSHLHAFRIGGTSYSEPSPYDDEDIPMENERHVPLADIVTRTKQKFIYEYDFGDGWEHEIAAEKFLPLDPAAKYPVCLGGARACPPEDCGGVPGYMDILNVLKVKKPNEEQEALLEWVGDAYDPEHFDLDFVNRRLNQKGRR